MTENERRTASSDPAPRGRAWIYALFLLVIPGLLWVAALTVPFLPLATGFKAWLIPDFAVAAEVVFWGAALVFGREVATRYRRHLDPRRWF